MTKAELKVVMEEVRDALDAALDAAKAAPAAAYARQRVLSLCADTVRRVFPEPPKEWTKKETPDDPR